MITFKDYINELFNSSYNYDTVYHSITGAKYEFRVNDDLYEVNVKNSLIRNKKEKTTIHSLRLDFNKNGSDAQDKSENPIKIFGTMFEILENHSYEDYDELVIAGKSYDKSRIKLYERFAKTLVKKTSFSKYVTETSDNIIRFKLLKV